MVVYIAILRSDGIKLYMQFIESFTVSELEKYVSKKLKLNIKYIRLYYNGEYLDKHDRFTTLGDIGITTKNSHRSSPQIITLCRKLSDGTFQSPESVNYTLPPLSNDYTHLNANINYSQIIYGNLMNL